MNSKAGKITLVSVMASLMIASGHFNKDESRSINILNRRPSSIEKTEIVESTLRAPIPKIKKTHKSPDKLARNIEATKNAYKKVLDYPSNTQPLDPRLTVDPIAQKLKTQKNSVLGIHSHKNELVAFMPKSYFTQNEKSAPINIKTTSENSFVNTELTLVIDNKESIKLHPSKIGNYQYELPLNTLSEGSHMVTVVAKFNDEEVINQLHFRLDSSLVEFVKSNSTEIDSQGNLVFSNDYHFFENGTYLVEGTLYTEKNELIGKAQTFVKANQGIQSVELSFYGYLLYQLQESGRFNLKNIQINQVDENLVTRGNFMKQIDQITPHLSWDQFNSRPYNNELVQDKLSMLE